jgi:protein-disulfide isomerase
METLNLKRRVGAQALLAAFFLLYSNFACSPSGPTDPSHKVIQELPNSMVLLEYSGGKIKAADIQDQVHPDLERVRDEVVQIYREQAEKSARDHLLAQAVRREGYPTVAEWLHAGEKEVTVSDGEVTQFIKQNHLEKSPPEEIKKFLREQRWISKKREMEDAALKDANFQWKITPAVHSLKESSKGMSMGADHPQYEIHEFCEFTNPLCNALNSGLERVVERHSAQVRWFFHPLSNGQADSTRLALGAICAGKQRKFREYAQAMYKAVAEHNVPTNEILSAKIGIDPTTFQNCLNDSSAELDSERKIALQAGTIDSPSIFVNGEKVNTLDEIESHIK